MNVGKLQDRVAVVTGAAGGLGAEAARVLAAHGAKIAVVDINNQAAEKVANDINGYPKAPPSFRVWGGGTIESSDIRALLPWIEWAYSEVKSQYA